jgi:hypothetical protein
MALTWSTRSLCDWPPTSHKKQAADYRVHEEQGWFEDGLVDSLEMQAPAIPAEMLLLPVRTAPAPPAALSSLPTAPRSPDKEFPSLPSSSSNHNASGGSNEDDGNGMGARAARALAQADAGLPDYVADYCPSDAAQTLDTDGERAGDSRSVRGGISPSYSENIFGEAGDNILDGFAESGFGWFYWREELSWCTIVGGKEWGEERVVDLSYSCKRRPNDRWEISVSVQHSPSFSPEVSH